MTALLSLSRIVQAIRRFTAELCVRVARGVLRLIKEWHYRADIHKLQAMSDRQLSDIGLSRSRIEEAVRGGVPGQLEPRRRLGTVFHR